MPVPFVFGIERGGIMKRRLMSSTRLLIPLAMLALTELGLAVSRSAIFALEDPPFSR